MAQMLTGNSWNRVKDIIRKRDREVCVYCGNEAHDGEPDHVLPLEQNGHDGVDNLVWSCKNCNRSKGNITLRAWVKKLIETGIATNITDINEIMTILPSIARLEPICNESMSFMSIDENGVTEDGQYKITIMPPRTIPYC